MYRFFSSQRIIKPLSEFALQIVHFKPNKAAYLRVPPENSWLSIICKPFQQAFSPEPPSLTFASDEDFNKAMLFAETLMMQGEEHHVKNKDKESVHTHFSTPEFTFYPRSGPFNLYQFQQFFRLIEKSSRTLDPGISWHLASFPLMVAKKTLGNLHTQQDFLSQSADIIQEFNLQNYALVNIAMIGQKEKISIYSKQIPSQADFVYGASMPESLQNLDDGRISNYPFGKLHFGIEPFKVSLFSSREQSLFLLFDMCNDHNNKIALNALKQLTSLEINALYEIVSSGLPTPQAENSPAILASVNDLQKGSDLLIIEDGRFNPIHARTNPVTYPVSDKTFFGQGFKETIYLASLKNGLHIEAVKTMQKENLSPLTLS